MAGGCGLELGVLLRGQVDDLSAPAEANDGPLLDALALAELINNLGNAWQCLRGCCSRLEEFAKLLLLLLVVRRVPGDVRWAALKEVRHENLVLLLLVCIGENVGTLESLREEAKDVIDNQNSGLCILGAGSVW